METVSTPFTSILRKLSIKCLIKVYCILYKLQSHGITGSLLQWIAAWLIGRKQRVHIARAESQWTDVTSGVPQGSVLGPLLFLLFINDLGIDIHKSTTVLKFADDTKLFGICNNESDYIKLQEDVSKLESWALAWQMKFKVDKCTVMHIGSGNKKCSYQLGISVLEFTDIQKDLRIWKSNDLKFEFHTLEAYKKANKMLGMIKRTVVHKDKCKKKLRFRHELTANGTSRTAQITKM